VRKKQFTNKWISARMGALPSKIDVRSFEYMKVDRGAHATTPAEYHALREFVPDNFSRSQGSVGSCVGWDWNYIFETQTTLLSKHVFGEHFEPTYEFGVPENMSEFEEKIYRLATTNYSAGWAYQLSRMYSVPPVPRFIEGSTNLGAVRAAEKIGIVPEVLLPTDTTAPFDFFDVTVDLKIEAAKYRIGSYHNVPNDNETLKATMYGAIHELPYKMPDGSMGASPLMSAFPVYSNFKDSYDDGIVPMPEGKLLGGHSSPQYAWRVIDGKEHWGNFGSWGPDIGDNGWFWIPFDYPFYPNDWWLMKILKTTEPPEPTCIVEDPNWLVDLLNRAFSDESKYYRGREVI